MMPIYHVEYSGQFKKDVKLAKKCGKDIDKLKNAMNILIANAELPQKYKDHGLKGSLDGYRDIHIEPDWLLIYIKSDNSIRFERSGTHSDLFKK